MREEIVLTNYHTHCELDDGNGSLEEYVVTAIEKGFTALGFSCHTPGKLQDNWHMKNSDFEYYLKEIERLKKSYGSSIELYSALELDYLEDTKELVGSEYRDQLDYVIGALHLLKRSNSEGYLTIDGPIEEFIEILNTTFKGDIKAFVHHYYAVQIEMLENYSFDFLAHCDLMKKRNKGNRFFNPEEAWYQELTLSFLERVKELDVRVEVNTGGMSRGAISEPYPSGVMLERISLLEIPVVLSSDAHHADHLDSYFDSTVELMKQSGITTSDILLKGEWRTVPL